ncbi:origin recognition complex subunit 2 isoform X1 [Ornithorhynchus anatinus]|uniref:origin recognition complex subunit 2 isoform X1 n=1 Tax=Ornithorhynchus anatinus TaxID=9258 RepID=UPI0010A78A19|nr:origin recognition complex subunit 2 isoform X1 [Ornithorhynchus anatinus]
MSHSKAKEVKMLEVQFVGDDDVLNHILEKEEGAKLRRDRAQLLVNMKKLLKKQECDSAADDQEVLKEKNYVDVLGTDAQESLRNGCGPGGGNGRGGSEVYTFQTRKHSEKMAELASQLAKTPGKSVPSDLQERPEKMASTPQSSKKRSTLEKTQSKVKKKNEFVSTTPYRLRKRLTVPSLRSDSESDYSASDSEDEETATQEEEEEMVEILSDPKPSTKDRLPSAEARKKTPAKKMKTDPTTDLVEEYFEAHSSSKVLTSDRTLQKLQRAKLDQQTLRNLLNKVSPTFSAELKQLNQQHEQLFHKWMLQLHLRFNIVLYGLGSKRDLLEKFRTSMLQDSVHVVINGFFPGITLKSILNSITEEVLDHMGTFRSVLDQLDWIIHKFKEDSSLELYLLIHNLDSQMLRGDRSQQILGQLSALPNIYLIASIDHINAPLMWDHSNQSLYNWLWYETTTYNPYIEETSYENSLLVQHSGALALSSLTHVIRSLTPNARGIFQLLTKYQLENKDNPSYIGLSFQDFYQQCREAFLVNSDLTLRAQLTEFRDHKLIRTKKAASTDPTAGRVLVPRVLKFYWLEMISRPWLSFFSTNDFLKEYYNSVASLHPQSNKKNQVAGT